MVMFVLGIKLSKEEQLPHFYKLVCLTICFPSALKNCCEVVLCWTCQCWQTCAAGTAWRIQRLNLYPATLPSCASKFSSSFIPWLLSVLVTRTISVYSYWSMNVVRKNEMEILTSFCIVLGESDKCKRMLHEKSCILSQVCKLTDSPQSLPQLSKYLRQIQKPCQLLQIITVGYKTGA